VLIDKTTNGVQESPETLDWALKNVASGSRLFRTGINVQAPAAIANPVRLTDQEADLILQRDQKTYPGGKTQANSMLARALQQNLPPGSTWGLARLGRTLGCYYCPQRHLRSTMLGALQTAEAIILSNTTAKMEYAKDIADMINNGQVNADPPSNIDSAGKPGLQPLRHGAPPAKQPPALDKMPKAPKQEEPKQSEPGPAPSCSPGNTYTVENATENPFHSIKFNFASGNEVKNGGSDVFKYTLPADVVAAMTSMQVEAKAATESASSCSPATLPT